MIFCAFYEVFKVDDPKIDRKNFLKKGPILLFRAFLEGSREESIEESLNFKRDPPADDIPLLRPPGAVPEAQFLDLCEGAGACAEACPADAILLLPRKENSDLDAPIIQPSISACVICDDLSCMKACPSGALKLVPKESIRIGIAKIDLDECLAWTNMDDTCNYCVEKCPIGEMAIRIESKGESKGPVMGKECVGCGLCEYHCPSFPEAVRVFELTTG